MYHACDVCDDIFYLRIMQLFTNGDDSINLVMMSCRIMKLPYAQVMVINCTYCLPTTAL